MWRYMAATYVDLRQELQLDGGPALIHGDQAGNKYLLCRHLTGSLMGWWDCSLTRGSSAFVVGSHRRIIITYDLDIYKCALQIQQSVVNTNWILQAVFCQSVYCICCPTWPRQTNSGKWHWHSHVPLIVVLKHWGACSVLYAVARAGDSVLNLISACQSDDWEGIVCCLRDIIKYVFAHNLPQPPTPSTSYTPVTTHTPPTTQTPQPPTPHNHPHPSTKHHPKPHSFHNYTHSKTAHTHPTAHTHQPHIPSNHPHLMLVQMTQIHEKH